MQLLKNRDFGDYFSDTFQFFKENFKGLVLNYFKLQGILLILIIIAGYFYGTMMNEQITNGMIGGNPSDPEAALSQITGLFSTYLSLSFLSIIILGSLSAIISANYIPIYMDLYNANQSDISFTDIVDKFKENAKRIVLLTLVLILLFIPIYIVVGIVFFITLFTLVGWIFVLGFCLSYFSQIWFNSNYYKSGAFQTLGDTFSLYKDNFWKITGATTILFFIIFLIYYIVVFGIAMLISNNSALDSLAGDPTLIYSDGMMVVMTVIQAFGLTVGTIITLLVQIQQGIIFYSRINEIEQISEHKDINSIGEEPLESDHSSFIQNH